MTTIFLTIECQKTPPEIYQSPSWNSKKANWEVFKKLADENCKNINLEQQTQAIHSGWNNQQQELHDAVSQARIAQEQDPTDANV